MGKFSIEKQPFDLLLELAQKHKIIRRQLRITQSELAKRSGVSLGSIKRFEITGQISLESLLKSSHVLNRLSDFDLLLNTNHKLEKIEKLFSKQTTT